MLVQRLERRLLLFDFELDLPYAFSVADNRRLGQVAMQLFNTRLSREYFIFQVRHFAIWKAADSRLRSRRLLSPLFSLLFYLVGLRRRGIAGLA